jgi:hypothetical protein
MNQFLFLGLFVYLFICKASYKMIKISIQYRYRIEKQ